MSANKEISNYAARGKLQFPETDGFFTDMTSLMYTQLLDTESVVTIPIIHGNELSENLPEPIVEAVLYRYGLFETFLNNNDIEIANIDLLNVDYIREQMEKIIKQKTNERLHLKYHEKMCNNSHLEYINQLYKNMAAECREGYRGMLVGTLQDFFDGTEGLTEPFKNSIPQHIVNDFIRFYTSEHVLPPFLEKIDDECGICMSSGESKKILTPCCNNGICYGCIKVLVSMKSSCPFCRNKNLN
jgi:hypothetical protein